MGMVKSQKVFAKFTCPKRLSVEIPYGLVRFIAVNQKPMPAMGTLAPDGTATRRQKGPNSDQGYRLAIRPEVLPREIVVKL